MNTLSSLSIFFSLLSFLLLVFFLTFFMILTSKFSLQHGSTNFHYLRNDVHAQTTTTMLKTLNIAMHISYKLTFYNVLQMNNVDKPCLTHAYIKKLSDKLDIPNSPQTVLYFWLKNFLSSTAFNAPRATPAMHAQVITTAIPHATPARLARY